MFSIYPILFINGHEFRFLNSPYIYRIIFKAILLLLLLLLLLLRRRRRRRLPSPPLLLLLFVCLFVCLYWTKEDIGLYSSNKRMIIYLIFNI